MCGRGVRHDVANNSGCFRFTDRSPDNPNEDGKNHREQKTEERPGKGDDDFVERRNLRQLRAIDVGLAFDDVHRCQLWQCDEAAERERTEGVLHTVNRLFPERFAEPDTKFLDVKAAPACRQEVTDFVYDNEQIKKCESLQADKDDTPDVENHGGYM